MNKAAIELRIKKRINYLLFFFAAFGFAAGARLYHTSIEKRDSYLEICERMSSRTKTIQAIRGNICDRNGKLLAWTTRHYDLMHPENISSENRLKAAAMLRKLNIDISPDSRDPAIVKKNLSPRELSITWKLAHSNPAFFVIKTTFVRNHVDYPKAIEYIGDVKEINGTITGMSGIELQSDDILRGENGEIKVILDRDRKWIPGTIQILKRHRNGKNLKLDISLEDILKREQ